MAFVSFRMLSIVGGFARSSWTAYNFHYCSSVTIEKPSLNKLWVPLIVQMKEIKSKRQYSNSGKLTVKPKTLINLPKSTRKKKDVMTKRKPKAVSDADYLDDVDLSSEVGDAFNSYEDRLAGMKAKERHVKDMVAFQNLVRAKTLEKKYFRPPKKLNLLTWAAKEQMRILHQNDPDEWTIESLAKVFPVGKESVRKILQSKLRLREHEDILRNDLNVKENWERILLGLKLNEIDSESVLKKFLEDLNAINIIENAMSSPNLPTVRLTRKTNLGVFSEIIKDELERQEERKEKLIKKQECLNSMLSDLLSEVQSILVQQLEAKDKKISKHNKNLSSKNSQEKLICFIKSRFQDTHEVDQEKRDSLSKNEIVDPLTRTEAPHRVSLSNDEWQQKSFSYRVDDCVYDENGEFLYKVP